MSTSVSARIGRIVLSLVIEIIVTGLVVSGLVWTTSLRERGSSNDSKKFDRQTTFFVALLAIVVATAIFNRSLNPRYRIVPGDTPDSRTRTWRRKRH